MDYFEYMREAIRTEADDFKGMVGRLSVCVGNPLRLLHAALGLADEVGELAAAVEDRAVGKPFDDVNLKEELGDLLWYVAIGCDALQTNMYRAAEVYWNQRASENRRKTIGATLSFSYFEGDDKEYQDRLLYGLLSLSVDVGRAVSHMKRHIVYGTKLDPVEMLVGFGGVVYAVHELVNLKGWAIEEIMELNIAKLRTRYPDRFVDIKAIHRDVDAERRVLEGKE